MRAWLLLLAGLVGCGGKAIRDAEQAVLTDPGSVEVWVMLGDTYHRAHRNDDALGAYQRALSLAPDSEEVATRIAELGGSKSSSKLERKALRNPLDDELWGDLGDQYALEGQRDAALKAYMYAFQLDPGDSEWQRKVVELGGLDQIVSIIEEQSSSLSDDERLGDFGDLLAQAGNVEEACALYERAASIDPSDGEWPEKLATTCGISGYGMVPEGSVEGSYAIQGASTDTGLTALGRSAYVSGDKARALEYFQAALLDDPSDKEALTGVMVLTGKTLVEVLTMLTTRLPGSDELWGDLGDAKLAVGDLAGARDAYAKAAELDPGDAEWIRKRTLLDPGVGGPRPTPSTEPLFQLPQ